jgi:hypothetical protein
MVRCSNSSLLILKNNSSKNFEIMRVSIALFLTYFLLTAFSCQKETPKTPPTLIGQWKDVTTYYDYSWPNSQDTSLYDNCLYTFYDDNTFKTENEIPLGILHPGVWSSLNPPTVYFTVKLPIGLYQYHEWEILEHTETDLEVISTVNHLASPGVSGALTTKRRFIRVE